MKSLFALEELEIEKVLNQQQQANSGNEFDNLYYEAQQKQKLQEVNSEEESVDDNEPVDEGSEVNDSSEETEASEPDEEQVATEAISQHSYHIVQEELPENLITIKDGLIYIGQAVFGVAKYFTVLGIEHIPKLLGRLYKGVVYVLSRIAKLFTVGLYRLEKYIEKRKYAIAQFKSKIESAEKALQAIQNKDEQVDLTDQKYTDVKNINMLKISEEIDFIKTVNAYNEFLDNAVKSITDNVRSEIMGTKQLISYQLTASVKAPMTFMKVKQLQLQMNTGSVEGYDTPEHTESYHYKNVLPGDVLFIANLPRSDIDDIAILKDAYHRSQIFLGFNQASFKPIETVDYMNVQDLAGFLASLKKLFETSAEQVRLYEQILREKTQLKYGLRNYIQNLSNQDSKVNLSDSLAEYVYLKTLFTEQVYIKTAMDVQEYAGRILSAGLSYVEANIKRLS